MMHFSNNVKKNNKYLPYFKYETIYHRVLKNIVRIEKLFVFGANLSLYDTKNMYIFIISIFGLVLTICFCFMTNLNKKVKFKITNMCILKGIGFDSNRVFYIPFFRSSASAAVPSSSDPLSLFTNALLLVTKSKPICVNKHLYTQNYIIT